MLTHTFTHTCSLINVNALTHANARTNGHKFTVSHSHFVPRSHKFTLLNQFVTDLRPLHARKQDFRHSGHLANFSDELIIGRHQHSSF